MTKIFVGGPIDFQDLSEVAAYRLRISRALTSRGYQPIDQYTDAIEQFGDILTDQTGVERAMAQLDSLPNEPYVRAVKYAVEETSIEEVLASPALVPELIPDDLVAAIVERDLELVEDADGMLAYLPQPSCGTMVEMFHANDHDHPVVVVSEQPPMFVRYVADQTTDDLDNALDALEEVLEV